MVEMQVRYRNMRESLEEMRGWPRDDKNHDVIDQATTAMRLELERREKSPAFLMIENVWNYSLKTIGFSWLRLNTSMHKAVELAIFSGMKFDRADFGKIADKFRMGYWGHGDGFYVSAVRYSNVSACNALEEYMGMKPYIVKFGYSLVGVSHISGRLAVGASFMWDGHKVTVTSMAKDHIIACSYRQEPYEVNGHTYYNDKLEKRYHLTRKQLTPKSKKGKQNGKEETTT